jgi:hypothetical protein
MGMKDVGIDGRIILKWSLMKFRCEGVDWMSRLMLGTSGSLS